LAGDDGKRVVKVWAAVLLMVDVVDFSKRCQEDQAAIVHQLVALLMADPLVNGRSADEVYVSSTGDGFIAAFGDGGAQNPSGVCDLARSLVLRAGDYRDSEGVETRVRVGLHYGEMQPFVERVFDGPFSVGTGLNRVARLGDLAGPGQVLASEEFVKTLLARKGARAAERFYPQPKAPPLQLRVKHGEPVQFRVLVGEGLSDAPPPKIQRIEAIGLHLHNALEIVGESLVAGLRRKAESESAAAQRMKPRLTLWVPTEEGLCSLPPRVQLPATVGGVGVRSTVWPISSGPQAAHVGPVAQAFATATSVTVCDLPNANQDEPGYYRRWREMHVDRQVVANFSRASRAIIVIPLVLFPPTPVGCLCCDFMDPLHAREGVVASLIESLRLKSSYFIASLLHLRAS
jgi:class 3 adenylate cyclase